MALNWAKSSNGLFLISLLLFTYMHAALRAQGDGPLSNLIAPKDLTALSPMFIDLNSNSTPSYDVILSEGEIAVNAFVLPIVRTFSVGGRLGQLYLIPAFGNLKGRVNLGENFEFGNLDLSGEEFEFINKTGFLDSDIRFRLGLLNAPAMDLKEFSKWKPRLQVYALIGITIPTGEYDAQRRVNLGSNRWAFRFSFPIVLPLGNMESKANWEIIPSVYFHTKNNQPFVGASKNQKAIFKLEQHISKFFTKKFWGSAEVVYQYGGETSIDELPKGNVLNQLAAGVTVGYAILPPWSLQASVGRVWFEDRGGQMFRLKSVLTIPSRSDREFLESIK